LFIKPAQSKHTTIEKVIQKRNRFSVMPKTVFTQAIVELAA
jgi:hypothetical protein